MQHLKRIRTFWIWIVFIFIALFLVSSNLGKRRSWNPAEQIIVELTAPIQKSVKQTVNAVEGLWLNYFALVGVRHENTRLQREINALRMDNDRYREVVAANRRLKELLQFKETINWPVLAAQVIGRDPSGWFESVIIDKGKNAGLTVNMPVVDARGVVGRLVSVSPGYAKVLLVIDQNSAVDGLIQRSREKGIVKGLSSKFCKLDYVVKTSDVVVGDRVVTSGMGRVFPKGLPVGEVVEVANIPWEVFKEIKVRPMLDFAKLEEVLVILKEDPLSSQPKETE
ncbi:MAG: rod shape-determining protein MreC [Desulfobacterales bacterium]|nr:rod shape-determining protein MreC [Desulfobacterales bacterium]